MSDAVALNWVLGAVIVALISLIWAMAAHEERSRKSLKVGDKAPQALLEHKPEDGPLGGFITICPECDRIDNIWHP